MIELIIIINNINEKKFEVQLTINMDLNIKMVMVLNNVWLCKNKNIIRSLFKTISKYSLLYMYFNKY